MPYVKNEMRMTLEFINPLPSNAGELNYAISHLCHRYITEQRNGMSYANVNEVVGVLACVQAEFYRTVAAPYEDGKARENGPVSDLDKPFFETVVAGPVTVSGPAAGIDVTGLANALAAALQQPREAAPPAAKRRAKAPAAPAQQPVAAPQPVLMTDGLGNQSPKPLAKGETRVLTGPIPGDVAGAEVRQARVQTPTEPKMAPPGKDASAAEKLLYNLAEGNDDEF